MADAGGTPAAWRIAAAAALVGGFWLGLASADRRVARLTVMAVLGGGLAAVTPIARAGRRPPIPPRSGPARPNSRRPTFTVVIAGRDEATVLPRLLADLGRQDHRGADGPLWDVIVIDDRSTDGSAAVAAEAATKAGIADVTRIVRRDGADLPDGKGAALTAVPPETYRGDVIVVLDADARVGPAFLSTLAHYVEAGAQAITARRRILDADGSWLAGAQADEQTIDGELQRGRWALGGLSEFRGNGIVIARDLLVEVGGWRAEALTEDLDLSSRVAAARGHGVAWAIDAEVWEEPVRDWGALWRQRVRWAEGAVRRMLEHGPAVVLSPLVRLPARVDFVAYGGQLLAPPVLLGAAVSLVSGRRWASAGLFLGAYATAAGGLAWDALRWEAASDGRPLPPAERASRAVRAVLFGLVWLAAVPAALWRVATRRGAVPYEKMQHHGVGAVTWDDRQ